MITPIFKYLMCLGLLIAASINAIEVDSTKDTIESLPQIIIPSSAEIPRISSDTAERLFDAHPLTLNEAARILIRTNPDIQQAKARWLASISIRKSAWGDFEPRLAGKFNRQKTTLPGPWSELKEEYKLGIQGLMPTATQYDLGFRHTGTLHSNTLSDAFFGITLRQPVMRGLWYDGQMSNLRIASDEERKFYHQLRSEISKTLGKLHSSYWDCFYASQLLEFENHSVKIAMDLLRDGTQRIANGKLSPLDLEKLGSELALRLSRRHDVRKTLEEARNQFALLLSSSDSILPLDFKLALPSGLEIDTSHFIPAPFE